MKEETILFWNNHFQMLELDIITLAELANNLMYSPSTFYIENDFTGKIKSLVSSVLKGGSWTEKDRTCLATHLALQMSGVESV